MWGFLKNIKIDGTQKIIVKIKSRNLSPEEKTQLYKEIY